MRTNPWLVAACAVASLSWTGCAAEQKRGEVGWTASDPSSMTGQTDDQAWARSTERDPPEVSVPHEVAATHARPIPAGAFRQVLPIPPSASLATSEPGREEYRTELSYNDVVGFFDRKLAQGGCHDHERVTTERTTTWQVRCHDGTSAIVAVHDADPVTRIEVVMQPPAQSPPTGVTNLQPRSP
jgi:hypothetical protein